MKTSHAANRHHLAERHAGQTHTLDICDFFPFMDRKLTLQAVEDIHELLAAKTGRRTDKKLGRSFRMHEPNKRLDCMGTGERELFHIIPFSA